LLDGELKGEPRPQRRLFEQQAEVASREALRKTRRRALDLLRQCQQMPQRLDGQIHIGEQIPGKRLSEFAKRRGHGCPPD